MSLGEGFGVGFRGVVGGGFPVENAPDPPILVFLAKSEDHPKKPRISFSAEPLKTLEKNGKTHKGKPQNEKSKENEKSRD